VAAARCVWALASRVRHRPDRRQLCLVVAGVACVKEPQGDVEIQQT